MLSKSLLLLALTGLTLAAPQVADITSDLGLTIPTDISDIDPALAFFSDIPTLPASVYSVLETAVPESEATETSYQCNPTAAPWYSALPKDVQTALTSYISAVQTWGAAHSSQLAGLGSYPSQIPDCGAVSAVETASGSTTGGVSSITSSAGGVLSSVTGSGTAGLTRSASGSGTAVTTTNSPAAAPRATGAIVGSFAGVVGALGVMAML